MKTTKHETVIKKLVCFASCSLLSVAGPPIVNRLDKLLDLVNFALADSEIDSLNVDYDYQYRFFPFPPF